MVGRNLSRPVALVLLRRAEQVLFVALLAVGAIRDVVDNRHPVGTALGALALAGWYGLGVVADRRRTLAWLMILTGGWAGLVVLSVDFTFLAFALFLLYLRLLPLRAALPAVALLTAGVIAAVGSHRGHLDSAAIVGPIIGAAVATVITVVYQDLRRESETRARLVAELTAAQDRLAVTQRQAGSLAERERLAHEIHDTIAQSLSSIILVLRTARDAPTPAPRQIDTAIDVARGALEDTRRLVRALTPAELVGRSLPEALRRLVDTNVTFGLNVRLTVDGDPYPLPTPVGVALLRAAQEALANVRSHADARHVGLTLAYQSQAVSLDVADDGLGFDPDRPPVGPTTGTGIGLAAMRARLAEVGGTLIIEAAPGNGTAISATIPIGMDLP